MNIVKSYLGLFIVFLLSVWAVVPLGSPGFFPMHDDTQPSRVYEMKKVLSEGQIPARWVPDLGDGYAYMARVLALGVADRPGRG